MASRSSPPRRRGRFALRATAAACALTLLVACADVEVPQPPAVEAPAGGLLVGAFVPAGVWQDMAGLRALEREVGRPFDVAHWFQSFDDPYDPNPLRNVAEAGRVPLISWQPMTQSLHDIANGHHDPYLRTWAQGIRDTHTPVYLRPFPEMNGDWTPWNGDPQTLRAAWIHLTTLFEHEGAHNVRWVWSPNVTDEPRTEANRMEHYYPGDDHVDILALSGYNWGDTRPYIGWRSFEEIFAGGYARLEALGPQPVWIAEVASTDVGGDKAAWIRDMFATTAFPRMEAIVWFDEDKEADWRVTSAPEVVAAFQESLGLAPMSAALR